MLKEWKDLKNKILEVVKMKYRMEAGIPNFLRLQIIVKIKNLKFPIK
jgi:hypothetical protein